MTTASGTFQPAPGFEYGPLRDDAELAEHVRTTSWCFRVSEKDCRSLFARMGTDRVRLLRRDGRNLGGLSLYSAGQWFGGRSVPMAAIGLVGIAPESRGQGVATNLMNACVLDARASGHPLSALYPAKQTLYRRSGWELAGGCWGHTARPSAFALGERTPDLRPFAPQDEPAVRALHREVSAARTGELDREDYLWTRVIRSFGQDVRGFVVDGADGLDGYVFLYEVDVDGDFHDLVIGDHAARTREALLRILRFVGDHSTLVREVRWTGAPLAGWHGLLREQTWKTALRFQWMLRICDVKGALEGRGYPPGVEAELPLEVDDPVVPENCGRFLVRIADGAATVEPGGSGALRLGVRALASIYSGWMTPSEGRFLGAVEGADALLARADRVFTGPSPWMSDMF